MKSVRPFLRFGIFNKWLRFGFFVASMVGVTSTTHASELSAASATTWASNLPSNVMPGPPCLPGDAIGNGATDLVCVSGLSSQNPGAASVLQDTTGSSSGFNTTTPIGTITSSSMNTGDFADCALADFDGDGRDDLACFKLVASGGETANWPTIWFSSSTPLSLRFSISNEDIANSTQAGTMPIQGVVIGVGGNQTDTMWAPLIRPFSSYCYVGHFMAGAGQQILCNQPQAYFENPNGTIGYGPTNNTYYLWRFVASYSASGAETVTQSMYNWTGGPPNPPPVAGLCMTGDFNGDGLTDLTCVSGLYLSTGTGFVQASSLDVSGNITATDSGGQGCATGDFNGDGKTDVICFAGTSATSSSFNLFLSAGSSFLAPQNWTVSYVLTPQSPSAPFVSSVPVPLNVFSSICTTADLNGDGKTDLLCYANNPNDTAQWTYALSTGAGFTTGTFDSVTPPSYAFRYTPNYGKGPATVMTNTIPFYSSCILGNFIGNGIPDILCNPDSVSQTTPLETYFNVGIVSRN